VKTSFFHHVFRHFWGRTPRVSAEPKRGAQVAAQGPAQLAAAAPELGAQLGGAALLLDIWLNQGSSRCSRMFQDFQMFQDVNLGKLTVGPWKWPISRCSRIFKVPWIKIW
jgi:hypothetical protein